MLKFYFRAIMLCFCSPFSEARLLCFHARTKIIDCWYRKLFGHPPAEVSALATGADVTADGFHGYHGPYGALANQQHAAAAFGTVALWIIVEDLPASLFCCAALQLGQVLKQF